MSNIDNIIKRGCELEEVTAWIVAYRPDPALHMAINFTPWPPNAVVFTDIRKRDKFVENLQNPPVFYIYTISTVKIKNYLNFAIHHKDEN